MSIARVQKFDIWIMKIVKISSHVTNFLGISCRVDFFINYKEKLLYKNQAEGRGTLDL